MSMNHLPEQDLALFVLGALEPAEMARLEAHVAVCPRCAAALAAEAQLEQKLQAAVPAALRELALRPVAASPPPRPLPLPLPMISEPSPARRRWPVAAMLAASLAVVLGLSVSRPPPSPPPRPPAFDEAALSGLSVASASEPFSEWRPEAAPLQCGLPGGGLLCQPQLPAPPAVLREAAFSTEVSWLPPDGSEWFTPITTACYAPR
jgi:hypothetical protein